MPAIPGNRPRVFKWGPDTIHKVPHPSEGLYLELRAGAGGPPPVAPPRVTGRNCPTSPNRQDYGHKPLEGLPWPKTKTELGCEGSAQNSRLEDSLIHPTEEESETQREVTCPRSHSELVPFILLPICPGINCQRIQCAPPWTSRRERVVKGGTRPCPKAAHTAEMRMWKLREQPAPQILHLPACFQLTACPSPRPAGLGVLCLGAHRSPFPPHPDVQTWPHAPALSPGACLRWGSGAGNIMCPRQKDGRKDRSEQQAPPVHPTSLYFSTGDIT